MRRILSALVVAFASLSFSPAQAGGLLQDLFAPAPRPTPIVHSYAPAQPQIRFLFDEGLRVSRRAPMHRKAIAKRSHTKRWGIDRKRATPFAGAQASRMRIDGGRRTQRVHAPRLGGVSLNAAKVAIAKETPVSPKSAQPSGIDNDPTLRVGDAYMTPEGLRIYRGASTRVAQKKAFIDFRRSALGAGVKSQLAALENGARVDHGRRMSPPIVKSVSTGVSERKSVDRQGRIIRIVGP